MLLAMLLAALLCVMIGSYPRLLYDLLPFPVNYQAYDFTHVIAQLQLLFFAALAFVWLNLRGLYPPELSALNLDSDWTYRRLLPLTVQRLIAIGQPLDAALRHWGSGRAKALMKTLSRHHAPQGLLARNWPTGSMVLWVALLLGAYLLAYLFEVSDQ